ncbi:glycosyltransferase family 4 protein [Streptomyces cyaneofuscatus]|uniref:glycosyltransferase family 4 protein n=1 Tax=Streptomyces cyaneofuscatus TaxID=66883 RepID=UPI002E14A0AF|nr:glycosyltransferase family 4 protein [Streptomyces cyaneofuscatus]
MTRRAAPPPRFDVAIALTYYLPYTSGLTEVARTVAEGLAARGRRVAVVASRHDPAHPARETVNGVEVFRAPVAARIGRGVLSPGFAPLAGRVARASRVVNIHLPMLEAGAVARLAGDTPVVSTHHDDVWLPPGRLAPLQVKVVDASVGAALRRSAAVVVNNVDHAQHSRHWPLMRERRLLAIAPPCRRREPAPATFRETAGPHFGFLGRIAHEKGLHHLVDAFRTLPDPEARLLIAGDYSKVAGGSVVGALRTRAGDDTRIRFTGFLDDARVPEFYASLDAFALPSVAEESFGISQAEAMMLGVPSVASDAPGMRVPVSETGFGRLFPPGDAHALAAALTEAAAFPPERRAEGARATSARYGTDACLDAYDALFQETGAARGVAA